MQWRIFRLLLLVCLITVLPLGCMAEVKEPAVAGKFYPAGREDLKRAVDGFMAGAGNISAEGRLVAIIAPHAGYEYSGGVAAWAYKRLQGSAVNTVILLGPSHHVAFEGVAVYAAGSMRTPLGDVAINEAAARSLLDDKSGVTSDQAPFAHEHSLEVQLPFLQRTLKDFRIVPILIGTPTRQSFASLTERLTRLMGADDRTLLVVSSDFSHYHDALTAGTMDRKAIDALECLSPIRLQQLIAGGEGEMCGAFPAITP